LVKRLLVFSRAQALKQTAMLHSSSLMQLVLRSAQAWLLQVLVLADLSVSTISWLRRLLLRPVLQRRELQLLRPLHLR
jgi:tRNA C32,U32 (ribose-2'-O)-methylase TrmJ